MKSSNLNVSNKTQKIIIIVCAILLSALGIVIWRYATRFERYRKEEINNILRVLTAWENNEDCIVIFDWTEDLVEDPQFREFVAGKTQELLDNGEIDLLGRFLRYLEYDDQQHAFIRDIVTNAFMNTTTLEDAIKITEAFRSSTYYNQELFLTRDSQVIDSYINENGMQTITYEKGKGYYADKEDEKKLKRIGVDNSPLYDAVETIYYGDFKEKRSYGRKLDSQYQEKDYSYRDYYFRDNIISFTPRSGKCVWSGDYLFCFNPDGQLIDYCQIE